MQEMTTNVGTMKKKLAVLLAATATVATMAITADPASADDFDGDELFFGYPGYSTVDDVDYVNVRERNDRDGECRVDDIDRDGFVAEYEIVCYY